MIRSLPLLPQRDIVVFTHMITPLFVGRDKVIASLERAMPADRRLLLVCQLDPDVDDPGFEDLYDPAASRQSRVG